MTSFLDIKYSFENIVSYKTFISNEMWSAFNATKMTVHFVWINWIKKKSIIQSINILMLQQR